MQIIETVGALRAVLNQARQNGQTIGLVPTMGALHAGHASLIQAAAKENDLVVVSVFVNPTQFGPNEDFAAYPRTLESDAKTAAAAGAAIVFAPTPNEIYPAGNATWVNARAGGSATAEPPWPLTGLSRTTYTSSCGSSMGATVTKLAV